MEITYKKDGSQNYMIIKDHQVNESDYKLQMLANNNIEGLIPFNARTLNNQMELWYETTSLVSLENQYYRKLMTGDDIQKLVRSIKALIDHLKEYLLDVSSVMFSIDMIYTQRDNGKYWFCYCPEKKDSFHESIRSLFENLLGYIDHNDRKAVSIIYGILQVTITDDFSVNDLVECVNKATRETMEENSQPKNICEIKEVEIKTAEKKQNIFQRIIDKLTGANKYEVPEEVDFVYEENNYNIDEKDEYEDMTMLLTSPLKVGFTLRSLNLEEEIIISPKDFPCVVGNSLKSSDVHINSRVVSRVHIRISEELGDYYVEDLNSTNGTYINDEKIKAHQLQKIEIGDVITIANLQFVVE